MIREVIKPVAKKRYSRQPRHPFLRGWLRSFRHFFCTQCYRAGLAEREILDLMGYADSSITQLYRHFAHRRVPEGNQPSARSQRRSHIERVTFFL